MFPLAIMKKTGAALAVSAAVLAGSVAPAGADFHAYDHTWFQGELTQSPAYDFIDVPDNMLSSAANWTHRTYCGKNGEWWGEETTFRLNPNQKTWYVGDHWNDKTDHVRAC